MVLSFFVPGLGQLFNGHVVAFVFWLVCVPVGYLLFVIPGLILHFLCILDARR